MQQVSDPLTPHGFMNKSNNWQCSLLCSLDVRCNGNLLFNPNGRADVSRAGLAERLCLGDAGQ